MAYTCNSRLLSSDSARNDQFCISSKSSQHQSLKSITPRPIFVVSPGGKQQFRLNDFDTTLLCFFYITLHDPSGTRKKEGLNNEFWTFLVTLPEFVIPSRMFCQMRKLLPHDYIYLGLRHPWFSFVFIEKVMPFLRNMSQWNYHYFSFFKHIPIRSFN